MSNELLSNKYDYETNQYAPMAGTEDWIGVAKLGSGGGYDWCDFNAFYSPSARRYFWHGDSGCSCNSWSDDLSSAADFENGDRAALLQAWKTFAKDHEYSIHISEYLTGVEAIRTFEAVAP